MNRRLTKEKARLCPAARRGMSLIDVIVGVSIMTLVFFALFGAFKLAIEFVYSTKAKIGAVSLVSQRVEYIRSLPYGDIGTVGGIPAGPIAQAETIRLNGVDYTLRTLVLYTDAPEDGLEDEDENSITADYKTVKAEALWTVKGSARSTSMTSFVAPVGEETLENGGTLKVRVFDALVAPVSGASVRIVNSDVEPAIDTTVSSNAEGVAAFPGAPEASGYEIYVGKTGYSSAQTYAVSAENPSPSPGPVAVVDETTTTATFFIDRVSSLKFFTYEPPGTHEFLDSFADDALLLSTSSVTVTGGALSLLEVSPGVYPAEGNALSAPVAPVELESWGELSFASSTPEGAALRVQLFYFDGSGYALVPDTVLPGNATGLSEGPVDIASLDANEYSTLQLGAFFDSDGADTPALLYWSLSYSAGPVPLQNAPLSLRGGKTVGLSGGGAPIYKFATVFTTTVFAEWLVENVEWDLYELSVPDNSFDIAEACPRTLDVAPASHTDVSVLLAPGTAHSLRVAVSAGGVPLSGASISLGENEASSSLCGQAYFGNLVEGMHALEISKPGYQTEALDVSVLGDTISAVTLTPL